MRATAKKKKNMMINIRSIGTEERKYELRIRTIQSVDECTMYMCNDASISMCINFK